MSNQNNETNNNATNPNQENNTNGVVKFAQKLTEKTKSMTAEIAEKVKNNNNDIIESVVTKLTETEMSRRKTLLEKGLEMHKAAMRELSNIQPDIKSFDISGTCISSSFSEAQIKKLNAAREKAEKIAKAVLMAMDQANYDLLSQMVNQNQNQNQNKED